MRAALLAAAILALPIGAWAQAREPGAAEAAADSDSDSAAASDSAVASDSAADSAAGSETASDLGPRVYPEEDDGSGLGPRVFPEEEPDAAPEPRPDTVVVEPAQTGAGHDEGPDESAEPNASTASQDRPGRVQHEPGKEEIWETWWFWGSVGIVVIGVTLAIIVDVTTDDPASEPGSSVMVLRARF